MASPRSRLLQSKFTSTLALTSLKDRYVIYPSKDYRERLEKLHREKVKIIVIEEGESPSMYTN
jgi:hypothetical protein